MNEEYIGKKVIHNPEGVCEIAGIRKIETGLYEEREYYKLVPVTDESCAIYIPVHSIDQHIRALKNKKEILDIIKQCKEVKPLWINNEQKRIERRQKALKNDDAIALAKLIRSYHYRRRKDHLSIADHNWLKKAEQYLCSEIAEVLGIDFQNAVYKIIEI